MSYFVEVKNIYRLGRAQKNFGSASGRILSRYSLIHFLFIYHSLACIRGNSFWLFFCARGQLDNSQADSIPAFLVPQNIELSGKFSSTSRIIALLAVLPYISKFSTLSPNRERRQPVEGNILNTSKIGTTIRYFAGPIYTISSTVPPISQRTQIENYC